MPRKRRHVWRRGTKGRPDYCEMCGKDRTPETESTGCRPTALPGF